MNRIRKLLIGGAAAATAAGGGAVGAAVLTGSASAQSAAAAVTTASTSSGSAPAAGSRPAPPANFDPTKGGHVGANGVKEVLLTGTTAAKARAAALAAVPGGTIQRVETDAEGATYEAHMLKSDGTPVTVKMDASFKVTAVQTGGPGGPMGPGHPGPGGAGAPSAPTA